MPMLIEKPWHLKSHLKGAAREQPLDENISYVEGVSLLANAGSELICSASGYKISGQSFIWNGCDYVLFDLIGPALEGDASVYEDLQFYSEGHSLPKILTIKYDGMNYSRNEEAFDSLLNTAYHFRRNILKADHAQPPIVYWLEALEKIVTHNDEDKARQAAIVDLAHELPLHLEKVTQQPRRILNRIRDLERIQRVREIDKACLINLARRPGTGIAEKAGPSQRILAVRRQETNNTLENRVARHCCKLIRRAADHYLAFHHDVAVEQSKRMRAVSKFQRKAVAWEKSASFIGVTELSAPCKSPNYVLLQNPHYMRIWNAYRILVKNEEVRMNVWRWKPNLWKDIVSIGFTQFFSDWINSLNKDVFPINIPVSEDRSVGGMRGFINGRFLNMDNLVGPYIIGKSRNQAGTLYLVDSFGLQKVYQESAIQLTNADFYMVWEGVEDRKFIPFYCRPNAIAKKEENEEADDLIGHLAGSYSELCGAVLVYPASEENASTIDLNHHSNKPVMKLRMSINPRRWDLSTTNSLDILLQWMAG